VLRLALRPRWLALALVAVLAAAGMVRLGFWQLHRHEERTAFNASVRAAEEAAPVPPERLLSPGAPVRAGDEWQRVRATGTYDTDAQVLVRNRPYEGRNGYEVVTPLVTGSGTALLVERGWVPAGATAATVPDVPAPPDGRVTVTGWVRVSEPPDDGPAPPPGQVTRLHVPTVAADLPYPVYGGYVALTDQQPPGPGSMERPQPPDLGIGPHLAYAVQWWIFAGIALVGWVVLLRREAIDESRRDEGGDGPAAGPPGDAPDGTWGGSDGAGAPDRTTQPAG
jgi:cytochrome oxidase assembly protein ShyY1